MESFTDRARDAIIGYDKAKAVAIAREAIESGEDLGRLISEGYDEGIREVDSMFRSGSIFLPQVMASFSAMSAALDELMPHIGGDSLDDSRNGTLVVCSLEGDIHSIGKNILAAMLTLAGFNVINLGEDVELNRIADSCVETKAIGVCTSASMTATMVKQKHFEAILVSRGLKDSLITNVGGSPVTQRWCDEIGADMYSENADDAVRKFIALIDAEYRSFGGQDLADLQEFHRIFRGACRFGY